MDSQEVPELQHDGHTYSPPSSRQTSGGGMTVVRRTDKSLLMKFLHVVIRPLRPRLVFPKAASARGSQKLTPPKRATLKCRIQEREVDGVWVYDMTAKSAGNGLGEKGGNGEKGVQRRRLVYFAGGGWQMPPSPAHWAFMAQLATRVPGLTVTLVSYPLAPKSPAALAMPVLRRMYDTLLAEAAAQDERIFLGGDSSGGNIAISLVTWVLSQSAQGGVSQSTSVAAPHGIIAISPSTDLRHIDERLKEVEKVDPLLTVPFITSTAQAWSAGGNSEADGVGVTRNAEINTSDDNAWSSSDPRVSPVLADLEPLVRRGVKLYCITGTYDVLALEAHSFRDQCVKAGVEGQWLEWEGQMHCFPLAYSYGLKESKEGVSWIVDMLKAA